MNRTAIQLQTYNTILILSKYFHAIEYLSHTNNFH